MNVNICSALITLCEAAEKLRKGKLVAMPTETVYGLAADATNEQAIQKIFEAKTRPTLNPLIVHLATAQEAPLYVEWDLRAQRVADAFWPGPLTLILPQRQRSSIAKSVSAGLSTLALRVPQHPVAHELLKATARPLAAPSANISGSLSPTRPEHVYEAFSGKIPIIEGDPAVVGVESTVLDLTQTPAVILRPGSVTREALEKVIPLGDFQTSKTVKSPGQLGQHYSPKQPLRLNASKVESYEALLNFGPNHIAGSAKCLNLSEEGNLEEAASNLYSMLHALDHPQFTRIAVAPIPNVSIGVAINDRLKRAAMR